MAAPNELVFAALGGVGEIGMNLALYGYGPPRERRWIAVDVGLTFPGPELPGIEVVYPDISFLEAERSRLLGIIITHAHEDHYGALASLWPRLKAKVFASPFTAGLLAAKRASEPGYPDIPISTVMPGSRIQLGPFDVEFVAVAHSIPEPMALAIRTPLGTVFHTGDWKIDAEPQLGPPTDIARLRAIGDEGVLALVCNSTNAMREGRSMSEAAVAQELAAVAKEATGRIAFTLFASNAARLRSIARAAVASGRELVVAGRALRRVIDVCTELGYFNDLPPFREADVLPDLPAANTLLILSGSQGEMRGAMAQVAENTHRSVHLAAGDTVVFSSRPIPGNERPINSIVNRLVARGIKVITDRDRLVHVSGHPRRDELTEMYALIRPRMLLPVHGEAAHLTAQRDLGTAAGIKLVLMAPNGTIARLAPDPPMTFPEAIPTGRLLRDGTVIGTAEEVGVGQRRKMSFAGHVAVALVLDDRGEILDEPQVETAGIPERGPDGRNLVDLVELAARGAVISIPRPRRRDVDLVEDAIRKAVRAAVNDVWGKKPVCTVLIAVV